MSGYLFIFGNTPHLSRAELSVFFPKNELIQPNVALVDDGLDPAEWIGRLGGTVKIAKALRMVPTLSPSDFSALFETMMGQRRSFGVSSYTNDFQVSAQWLQEIKDEFERHGRSSRFVLPREGNALSSVVVAKEDMVELVVAGETGRWVIGQTVAVQDFEEWNRRDYDRPFVDPKAGMLPLKVARMAVNLASPLTRIHSSLLLLDPFCGMGTILGEALLTGWRVIGSDWSEDAVGKARKNLEFLQGSTLQLRKVLPCEIFVRDATHISEKLQHGSVDAIVTEPYLGPASIKPETIKNTIKGLEKLYIGCLRDWQKVLRPGGKVVIALPEYSALGRTYFVKKVIDNCETLGYTLLAGPIAYSRPQAVVRRKFYILQSL